MKIHSVSRLLMSSVLILSSMPSLAAPVCSRVFGASRVEVKVPKAMAKYLKAVAPDYLGTEMMAKHNNDAVEAYVHGRIENRDVLSLMDAMPAKVEHVLNIGGGAGIFEPLMAARLNHPTMTVIDKTEREAPNGSKFNIKKLAEEYWRKNDLDAKHGRFVTIENFEKEAGDRQYDAIVSFRALSFLFPFEWYGSFIAKHLRSGGVLVLDIKRVGSSFDKGVTDDIHKRFGDKPETAEQVIAKLSETVGPVKQVIYDSPNSTRVVFEKK